MKLYKISLALLMGIGMLTSCSEKLDVTDPNRPTTDGFGSTAAELEESVIAMYVVMKSGIAHKFGISQ